MTIEKQYCNFENSKLLKEAGFDIECYTYFNGKEYEKIPNKYPELWMVIEWLRLKHNIIIGISPNTKLTLYAYHLWKDRYDAKKSSQGICAGWNFNTPKEAYQEAIEYTLLNLIK